jgi:hypothetical protein
MAPPRKEQASAEAVTQIALRELSALVAKMVKNLVAPADNPLLVIEQLRGQVLRYQPRGNPNKRLIENRLSAIQNCCDELHLGLCRQPEAERWRTELAAYERAEYRAQKAQEEGS